MDFRLPDSLWQFKKHVISLAFEELYEGEIEKKGRRLRKFD
jgi:hypothetical protein